VFASQLTEIQDYKSIFNQLIHILNSKVINFSVDFKRFPRFFAIFIEHNNKMSRSVRAETRQQKKEEKKQHLSHLSFAARKWEKRWVQIVDTTMKVRNLLNY
jgi:hypothetical protein